MSDRTYFCEKHGAVGAVQFEGRDSCPLCRSERTDVDAEIARQTFTYDLVDGDPCLIPDDGGKMPVFGTRLMRVTDHEAERRELQQRAERAEENALVCRADAAVEVARRERAEAANARLNSQAETQRFDLRKEREARERAEAALREADEAITGLLPTINYYIGPQARTANTCENVAAYNRLKAVRDEARSIVEGKE